MPENIKIRQTCLFKQSWNKFMLDRAPTNNIYTIPDTQMEVEVILASAIPQFPNIPKLFTLRMRYPRIIHSEIMTHRVFSRNARSSRAVPVNTMINEVKSNPFIPWHWGANQKGMQAGAPLDTDSAERAKSMWLASSATACYQAQQMMELGLHKQLCNRLLEPFSYIDTLITATDWANFIWLRDHKDAEPHLQDLARLVKQALEETHVQNLQYASAWHLPYVSQEEIISQIIPWLVDNDTIVSSSPDLLLQRSMITAAKISAARCARISYRPFDGNDTYERELERYALLVGSDRAHASPMEHQAVPSLNPPPDKQSNLRHWIQFRKLIPNEFVPG
jgi:hypothetical protein